MSDVREWEKRFVDLYIQKDKRDRYRTFLNSRKRRKKFLDCLNHAFDYRASKAKQLEISL